jgi:hypothetical protein
VAAPIKAAGDTVAEALSSFVDTATSRSRRARKAAKKTKKQTRKAWSDFADETAARASNIVEAGKGGRVAPRGRRRRVLVLVFAGAVAVVVVVKKQNAPARDELQSTPTGRPVSALER